MLANAGEKLAQIGLGLDAVQLGGTSQGVENGGPLTSRIAAGEEPVFSAKSQGPDGIFGRIV